MNVIRDAIFGDIFLSDEEFELINTYEMQRLSRIKQLGFSYLVYPGATHTRLAHSLGTRYVVEQILLRSNIYLPAEEKRILFIGALLHDVSHSAFGHRIEIIPNMPSHEEVRKYILDGKIRELLEKHKILSADEINTTTFINDVLDKETLYKINALFDPKPEKYKKYAHLIGLLDNYIDADNLDYIKRDAFYLGLPGASYDDRIFSQFRITDDNEVVFTNEKTTIDAITSVIHSRYYLYKVGYLQHTSLIADAMVAEAIKEWAWVQGDRGWGEVPFIVGDEEMLAKLKNTVGEKSDSKNKSREIAVRIYARNLYKRAYVMDNSNLRARYKAEKIMGDIMEQTDFKNNANIQDDILIVPPRKNPWKEFGRILMGEKNPRPIGEKIMYEIKTWEDKFEGMWMFIIATKDKNIDKRRELWEKCKKYFEYEGIYMPSEKFTESQSNMQLALEGIKAGGNAKLNILKIVCEHQDKDRGISIEELSKIANLSRSTVSQYLNFLAKKFSDKKLNIINSKTDKDKKIKYWKIENKKDVDMMRKFIAGEKI